MMADFELIPDSNLEMAAITDSETDTLSLEGDSVGEAALRTQPNQPCFRSEDTNCLESPDLETTEQDVETYDLVVVGAGVAGLYAIWKILRKNPQYRTKKILMIDQASQIGGRLRTDIIRMADIENSESVPTDYPFVVCEEGAMRFCKLPGKQVMPCLINLIDQLGDLQMKKFKVAPDGPIDFRRHWFNGNSFTNWYADDNSKVWNDIFCLNSTELNKSPEAIFTEVYTRILKRNYAQLLELVKSKENADMLVGQRKGNMSEIALIQTTKFWYNFKKYFTWEKVAMYNHTMMSLMTVMGYSQGCITMLQVTGYSCLTSGRGNAGTILQMERTIAAISASESFYCFTEGFSSLTDSIYLEIREKLSKMKKWNAKLRRRVVSMKISDSTAEHGKDYTELTIENMNNTKGLSVYSIRAKDLILAIPMEAFDKIDIKSDYCESRAMEEEFGELVNSVIGVKMTKMNFYFSRPWWNTFGKKNKLYGESTTNLPISMVYPFYDEDSDMCALTMYCDLENAGFWSDLQNLPGVFTSELQSQYPDLVPASLELVEEALRELRILFNFQDIPYPLLTTYTRWAGDCKHLKTNCGDTCPKCKDNCNNPVAVHQWRRGIDDKAVRKSLAKPFPRSRVFVCNEAWSEFQGWVEGSLMAVDEVLQKFYS